MFLPLARKRVELMHPIWQTLSKTQHICLSLKLPIISKMDIVDTKYKIFIEKFGELRVRRDEPMVNHTHFKVGGPADLYFEPTSSGEFTQSVITCIKEKIPFIVLGAGANTF